MASLTHSLTRVFILAFVLILLLASALPALADYLGPDRTRTESDVETYDWGVWAKPDPTGNSCNHTYGTDCIVCIWERHPGSPCGDATYWYKVGTRSEVVERTVTYPEAVISASLDGCALRNGWYVSPVTLSASASDPAPGSGMETFTYTLNASPETLYTAPLTLGDGAHALTLRARDAAGHVTELSQSAQVDTLPPQAGLTLSTLSFCPECGQTLDVLVQASDGGSGLQGWQVFLGGAPWQSGSQTEQIFTLSAALAAGSHTLRLEARDTAGNLRATEAAFFVLAPTPTAPPTTAPANTVAQPTLPPPTVAALNTPSPTAIPATAAPLNTATPTRALLVSTFQSSNLRSNNPTIQQSANLQSNNPTIQKSANLQSANLPSPTPLWGAAALAAIAGASGLALVAKRRRKADEERQAAEAAQKAALRNAAQALRLAQNWLTGGQIKKAQKAPAPGPHPPLEAAEAAWLKKKSAADKKPIPSPKPPFAPAQWKGQACPSYRQGERAGYASTPLPPKMPTLIATPSGTPTSPPACTPPPTPQVFIGPAPTKQPTPTPLPPLTGRDVARGICESADLVDPVMPNPATVGGMDVGNLIDQAYVAQQNIPYGSANPLFESLIRVPSIVAKAFKDGPSTVVNFACQQRDKEGPYYELFPIDQKVQAVKDRWNQMDTRQKVFVVGVTLLALLIAIPLLVK